jgi:hypothetical protein
MVAQEYQLADRTTGRMAAEQDTRYKAPTAASEAGLDNRINDDV